MPLVELVGRRSIRDGVRRGFLAPSRPDPWNLGLGWVALLEPRQGPGWLLPSQELGEQGLPQSEVLGGFEGTYRYPPCKFYNNIFTDWHKRQLG